MYGRTPARRSRGTVAPTPRKPRCDDRRAQHTRRPLHSCSCTQPLCTVVSAHVIATRAMSQCRGFEARGQARTSVPKVHDCGSPAVKTLPAAPSSQTPSEVSPSHVLEQMPGGGDGGCGGEGGGGGTEGDGGGNGGVVSGVSGLRRVSVGCADRWYAPESPACCSRASTMPSLPSKL
jgi:hypothetical protein